MHGKGLAMNGSVMISFLPITCIFWVIGKNPKLFDKKKSMRNLDFPKKFSLSHGFRKFTIGFPIVNFILEKNY